MLRFGIFALSALLVAFQAAAASLPFNGADISSLPLLESQGISYKDNGQTKPFETILSQHGFHVARIRIWTAGTYTQQYAINLAKRAKNAGLKVLIDLHYSDTCKLKLVLNHHRLVLRPSVLQGLITGIRLFRQAGQQILTVLTLRYTRTSYLTTLNPSSQRYTATPRTSSLPSYPLAPQSTTSK